MRGALLVCSPLRSISCPFVETGSRRFRFRSIIRDHEVSPSVSQSVRSLIKFRGRRRFSFFSSDQQFDSSLSNSSPRSNRSLISAAATPHSSARSEGRGGGEIASTDYDCPPVRSVALLRPPPLLLLPHTSSPSPLRRRCQLSCGAGFVQA